MDKFNISKKSHKMGDNNEIEYITSSETQEALFC